MTDATAVSVPQLPRLTVTLTAISAVLLAIYLSLGLVDARLIDGVNIWAKPAKFAMSFVVFFASFAWLETRLTPAMVQGRLLSWTMAVMAAAYLMEMAYMTAMAAQAQPSHFNLSTPFHTFMYTLMGVGAVTLVSGSAVYAWAAWRDRAAAMTPELRAGVVAGFGLTLPLTLVVAGYLSSAGGHFVGIPSEGAATLPLLGWSAEVGDLRPAHFLSIHAMQALPLLGWLVSGRRDGIAWVWIAAGLYIVLTMALFVQALMGLPLVRL